MSIHENDQTVSHIPLSGDPEVGSVRVAEEAIKAFKTALRELGEPVPANDVRAVLTTSGLRLEVTEAPSSTVEHYGSPVPVEEVAEFLGEEAPLAVGDRVRITGDTREWDHARAVGTEGMIVELAEGGALVATDPARRAWGNGPRDARWVHVNDLERA